MGASFESSEFMMARRFKQGGHARRFAQALFMAILVLIPISGLLRIDLASASITIFDFQIWFSDIFIISGLMILIIGLLTTINSLYGSLFCGWLCPQNSISEFANTLTRKLLGRRADMLDLTGKKMQVATQKRSLLNYLLLATGLILPTLFIALIPLLYFYPLEIITASLGFGDASLASASFYSLYAISFSLLLLDITAIRHSICKHFCAYRVWQNAFKNSSTLRIRFDSTRSDHCNGCNYCADSCIVDIDPRSTGGFDGCIGCGECITACGNLHARSKKLSGPALLSYASNNDSYGARLRLALKPLITTGVGLLLLTGGFMNYQSSEFSVSREVADHGNSYRISIAHKLYRPAVIRLDVQGLTPDSFQLDQSEVHFNSVGRNELMLHLSPHLKAGLHRFKVIATSSDGWSGSFSLTHLVSGG
ncbi:4Fe-4S binding protein [Mariprofundus erugo]|uniref:4Fe-4S binding protein n=2 Tax=Mariprofundus erugo TaxID=2528639 RepID=A0A5R9GQT1_9PROT|nr:4Fe-4S binding protein [Mariprofundus erugo]